MSVMTTIYRLAEPEAERLLTASDDEALALLYGEEGWSRAGLVFTKWLALERHGGGVDLALTGGANTRPLSFIQDEEYGDETDFEFAYGPGRIFWAKTVKEIDAGMKALTPELIRSRLTLDGLKKIYPFTLRAADKADLAFLEALVLEVKDFVDSAAHAQECLVVTVD